MKVPNISVTTSSINTAKTKNMKEAYITKTRNNAAIDYNSKNQNLVSQINNMARKPISLKRTITPLKFSKLFYKALQKALMDISV